MDIEQFRKAGYQAIDRICEHFYALQEKPVMSQVKPGYLSQLVPATPPEKGEDFQIIADDFQRCIMPGITHWTHPSFFAYFPTANSFEGILGDLYASSVSTPGFNWVASPAATELESIVLDWAACLLGLSSVFKNTSRVGGGVIQTTASDSVLTAVVAARSLYQRNHPDVPLESLVIYTTTQTHSLGAKAGLILGIKVKALEVKLEDQLCLRGEDLEKALEKDTNAGLRPFILIATVGTTSSGAIDDIPEIGEVVKSYPDLWIHIDAAWAGCAFAAPELREKLYVKEINETAHSICVNFHKWGLVNFACSVLWVRDRQNLIEALDITPAFLRTKEGDSGVVTDYRNWHLSLGRRFRSLKLWFVLRSYGVEGFRNRIRRSIKLNEGFVELIKQSPNLTLVTEPSLALTVFRLAPKSHLDSQSSYSLAQLNELNKAYHASLASRSDIMLTQTNINGIFCIRLAVGSPFTEEKHIQQAYNVLEEEAKSALQLWKQGHAANSEAQV
ncbi:aromatic-L-amino-acid decarboxylase [Crepidotus variabilis]|uniref:Aromatic-L-amino-acid decarboxylase n=1 Tax=Crepidotus variabilis TaxID=179855 RepID=A0A9P6EG79_9AGAR|nr:aromatic-L-amino-acid decarboxylase [Crepidotus variabilis]